MHKSLRLKLTLMLMVIVLGIVICSTLISGLFLGDFYMMGKQKGLIETYNDVNRLYMVSGAVTQEAERFPSDNPNTDFSQILGEDFENSLERMSEGRGTSIVIFRTYDLSMFNGRFMPRPFILPWEHRIMGMNRIKWFRITGTPRAMSRRKH